MDKNKNFLITQDKNTADELIKRGFVNISLDHDTWVFINDVKKLMTFDHEELKLAYTDMLTF